MKFGLTKSQFEEIKKNVVDPLVRKGAIVYCFGSRARGDHRQFSDLDLMVEDDIGKNLDLGRIREWAQNSSLPFKVDLVSFSEFAGSYKNQYEGEKVKFG